jgi:hypothetical protein
MLTVDCRHGSKTNPCTTSNLNGHKRCASKLRIHRRKAGHIKLVRFSSRALAKLGSFRSKYDQHPKLMKPFAPGTPFRNAQRLGQTRMGVLLVGLVCAGLGAGLAFYFGKARERSQTTPEFTNSALSERTRLVLQNLDAPIEIRFYSLLDPKTVSESLQKFSLRVEQLVSRYEQEGAGKITVVRNHNAADPATGRSASADGLRAFNINLGDACFLGIAVVREDFKEALPQLSPDWEEALEADLSRVIARVADARKPSQTAMPADAKTEAAVLEEVKRKIPNFNEMSFEDGRKILRETALEEFKSVAQETESQLQRAQQRLSNFQSGGSDAEQRNAMNELLQIQNARSEKLKEIAARSQAQVQALERLKSAAGGPH